MKHLPKIFVALIVLVIAAIYYAATHTAIESHYPDGKEAMYLIKKGWLPDWFPMEAQDIHEKHDLDTNNMITAFKLPPEHHQKLLDDSTVTSPSTVLLPKVNIGTPRWWPRHHIQTNIDNGTWKVYSKLYSTDAPTLANPQYALHFTFAPNHQVYAWNSRHKH